MDTITINETGCYLDNHRGHYIGRDTIQFAQDHGFIIGTFEQFAVSTYSEYGHHEDFPQEGMIELCDEAIAWLNSGQDKCDMCGGTGKLEQGTVNSMEAWFDKDGVLRCKTCTGTGRGPRIAGQNFPPIIPEGTAWDFNDGDFGLYKYEDEE